MFKHQKIDKIEKKIHIDKFLSNKTIKYFPYQTVFFFSIKLNYLFKTHVHYSKEVWIYCPINTNMENLENLDNFQIIG